MFGSTLQNPAMQNQMGMGAQNQMGGFGTQAAVPTNPMKDIEVTAPPDDTVSAMEFSPATLQQNFLLAGSWDSSVRLWEVESSGKTIPKQMQTMGGSVLDVCWADVSFLLLFCKNLTQSNFVRLLKIVFSLKKDGTKAFIATCDKQVKCWDLGSNQMVQVAQHDAPVKTCHFVKGSNYTCLMTGSWDKTLKFWDIRYILKCNNILIKNSIIFRVVLFFVLADHLRQ